MTKPTRKERIEFLEKKKIVIDNKIKKAKSAIAKEKRKAEAHIKYVIGGAVLSLRGSGGLPPEVLKSIYDTADKVIVKHGLASEIFEEMKQKLKL